MKHNRKIALAIILMVYLIHLLYFTLIPFDFSLDTSLSPSRMYYNASETLSENTIDFLWDIIINIPLFFPFGFIIFALLKDLEKGIYSKIVITAFSGLILSFIIESFQLLLPRNSSIADLFANTIGTLIGGLIENFYSTRLTMLVRQYWFKIKKRKLLPISMSIYGAFVVVLFTYSNFPTLHSDFRNWDPGFTFQLGNEATLNRPWLGRIYLVAIYKHSLNSNEVIANFKTGPFRDVSQSSAQENLVSFYRFNEGAGTVVHDTSSFGLPLNLTVHDSSKIKWLSPGGIEFLKGTIIKSQNPADKLFYYLQSNKSLSVEVWVAPAILDQRGPARIVSLSKDPRFRNFTLGQEDKNIHFRLRTPITGLNGTDIHLQTKDDILTTEPQHLVATYRNGVEKLYVNGKKYQTTLVDATNNLLNLMGTGLKGRMTFCLLFLFPVGFLLYPVFSRKMNSSIKAISTSYIAGFSPLMFIEVYQVIAVSRYFDLIFLSIGFDVVFVSVMMSFILIKNIRSGERVSQ